MCSILFLRQKAIRSSTKPDSAFLPATKSCSNFGITLIAVLPKVLASVGTSRHPKIIKFSSEANFSISVRTFAPASINASPAAYLPASGSLKFTSARKNSSGIRINIPAPSPVSGSAPVAPRCSIFSSARKAF